MLLWLNIHPWEWVLFIQMRNMRCFFLSRHYLYFPILKVPTPTVYRRRATKRQVDSRARCLNDIAIAGPSSQIEDVDIEETRSGATDDAIASPSSQVKGPVALKKKRKGKSKQKQADDDDWVCSVCDVAYSFDARLKNGKKWVQCSYCCRPYHNTCLMIAPDENDLYVQCDACAEMEQ